MVTTRVPATTANLGPGYDCLGVALQIYNRVTVMRTDSAEWAELSQRPGAHSAFFSADDSQAASMDRQAAGAFFERAGLAPIPFAWSIEGEVPQSRGMGSSVTVRLGLLHGLNALAGGRLDAHGLFELCAALEGHPDNAAPAAFGGFTVAGGRKLARFEVGPELRFVLLIPDFEVSTPEARRVLPPQLDRLAAVQSCANACRITAAFAARDYEGLRGAFADGLHQPFRERLIPFLPQVIAAGEAAGALGGFLSGSGSTICCLTLENAEAVAAAMRAAAPAGARTVITQVDNAGAQAAV